MLWCWTLYTHSKCANMTLSLLGWRQYLYIINGFQCDEPLRLLRFRFTGYTCGTTFGTEICSLCICIPQICLPNHLVPQFPLHLIKLFSSLGDADLGPHYIIALIMRNAEGDTYMYLRYALMRIISQKVPYTQQITEWIRFFIIWLIPSPSSHIGLHSLVPILINSIKFLILKLKSMVQFLFNSKIQSDAYIFSFYIFYLLFFFFWPESIFLFLWWNFNLKLLFLGYIYDDELCKI